jgi:MerR family transcriptional regulator/heat shock protein HspR
MNNRESSKKLYHISAVAKMYDIHPQTLRLYEREGLLKPSRSDGNTRLYSEDDLKQLAFILSLTRDLGVNMAGIDIILNMKQKMDQIETEVNEFLEYVRREFIEGQEDEFEQRRQALIRITPGKIVKVERIENNKDE